MRRFFLLSIFLCVAFGSFAQFRRGRTTSQNQNADASSLNYTNPAEYTIAGIDVTGINVLDKNAMISISGLKIGDKIKIPGDGITDAIRKIWKYGLVGDISIKVDKIEGENVFLNIVLAERSRLTTFYFTGINKSQESGLKDDLTLIRGKIVNDAMIRNTELAVKKYFVKKGFLNTEVKIAQEKDTINRDGIKLKIAVDTKSKVKIHTINILGNSSLSDQAIKTKLKKTKEYPRFTLHRALIMELFTMKPRQFFGSNYKVSWDDTKDFLTKHVKPNVFSSSKFIKTD